MQRQLYILDMCSPTRVLITSKCGYNPLNGIKPTVLWVISSRLIMEIVWLNQQCLRVKPSFFVNNSPHLCVGFLFFVLYPVRHPSASSSGIFHNFVTHHLSHTHLCLKQICKHDRSDSQEYFKPTKSKKLRKKNKKKQYSRGLGDGGG